MIKVDDKAKKKKKQLIILVLLSVVVAILLQPTARRVHYSMKGKTCQRYLVMIYRAKQEFIYDNPGVNIKNVRQLAPYNNSLRLQCPLGGCLYKCYEYYYSCSYLSK